MSGSRWDDGLLDLFVGAGLVLIGIVWLIPPISRFGGLAPLVLLPLWPIARAVVSMPRSSQTDRMWTGALRRTVVLGVMATLLGMGMYRVATRGTGVPDDWVGAVIPAFLGVLIGIGAVSVGLLLGLARIMAYGVVVALLSAIVTMANIHAGIYLTISGAMIASVGAIFLRRYSAAAQNVERS